MKRIPNTIIYSIKPNATIPEVPKFFIEEQNRWVDNPNDPDFHRDLELYENYYKPEAAIHFLIDNYEVEDYQFTPELVFMLNTIKDEDESLEFAYKKYIVFANGIDKLVDESLLTEQRVYKYLEPLQGTATRGGMDIIEHELKFSIHLATTTLPLILGGYQLVHPVDEMACCQDNNINWMTWLGGAYGLDEMAQTIALWRIGRILEAHRSDEAAIHSEQESKKKH